ncbi:MAG: permease [Treponemataceae bacterium]
MGGIYQLKKSGVKMFEAMGIFIQEQILGMKWLNDVIGMVLSYFGMDIFGRFGASVHFFIYDVIKILVLLSVLIFGISYIQSFFPPERTRKIVSRFNGTLANIFAALLGTVTPFCSCSSIPLFIGFTGAGIPIGASFSFLISSPLVDLGAFILLTSIFGIKTAAIYVVVGLILAVIGGTLIEKLGFSKYVEDYILEMQNMQSVNLESPHLNFKDRLVYSAEQVGDIVRRVFWYVIIGVGIGALIHNWIPQEIIENVLGKNNRASVFLATLVGIPLYADIFGTIPIAQALFTKGVGIGTTLSFMMAVTALSLPSLILLRKAVKAQLLVFFVSYITVGIIAIGYFFNAIQFLLV